MFINSDINIFVVQGKKNNKDYSDENPQKKRKIDMCDSNEFDNLLRHITSKNSEQQLQNENSDFVSLFKEYIRNQIEYHRQSQQFHEESCKLLSKTLKELESI